MPPPKSCLISSGINQRRKQISYSVLNNYTRGRTFWWKRIQVILYGNNTWIWCSNHLMSSFFPLMQTKIPTTTNQNFESQVCWVCGVFLTQGIPEPLRCSSDLCKITLKMLCIFNSQKDLHIVLWDTITMKSPPMPFRMKENTALVFKE